MSFRSSIIMLLINYADKLIFEIFLGSWAKAMAAAHGMLILRNASQNNCSGEWTSHPQTFFSMSFDPGKASKPE